MYCWGSSGAAKAGLVFWPQKKEPEGSFPGSAEITVPALVGDSTW
jgi:hypothetical protein